MTKEESNAASMLLLILACLLLEPLSFPGVVAIGLAATAGMLVEP